MIKKISVRPIYAKPGSVRGSLAQRGLTRFPNSKMRIPPYLEINGAYRTGFDTNALYIQKIQDPTEKKMEIAIVESLREIAKKYFGDEIDKILDPRSDFYTKMTDNKMGTPERCPFAEMKDGDNIYNISGNREHLITYAYLRVHPEVAPSQKALSESRYAHCKYYVNDSEVENEETYTNKKEINKAIIKLDSLSPSKQRKVARQLNLPITESSSDIFVYNALDNYIKNSLKSEGKFGATRFLEICDIKDDNLEIMDIVKQCLKYNILKKDQKSKKIKKAGIPFADSEEDAIIKLSDPNNQDDLFALKEELNIKLNIAR